MASGKLPAYFKDYLDERFSHTDDKINGDHVRGREKALALGPGILASHTVGESCITVFLHALFDAHTKNRASGTTYQVRIAIGF